jgi:hypothetical protein
MLMQLFSTARSRAVRLPGEGIRVAPQYPAAPVLSFEAVSSGRRIDIGEPGVALLVFCLGQHTAKDAEPIEAAVREVWPSSDDVLVVHCVDLKYVPSMFRSIAEGMLANEHAKAVDELPAWQDAFNYVVILPDWKGELAAALDFSNVSKSLGAAVISADGSLVWKGSGPSTEEVIRNVSAAIEVS